MPATLERANASGSKPLWSLDWLNFWMADVQTGVGPFIAAALTSIGWNSSQVGTLLTIGGLTGLCLQTPAGAVVDATRRKRTLLVLAIAGIVAASLLLARGKHLAALLSAQVLLGAVAPFIGPCITAITLGLVAKTYFDARVGRNQAFNSAGNVFSALVMGWIGWCWGAQSIFFSVPFFAVPALFAVAAIPAAQINHAQARGSDSGAATHTARLKVLTHDRVLLAFAIAGFLFHLANAAMLPQLAELLARGRPRAAAPFMSAAVSVTQIVIALTASAVGKSTARCGPRRILLVGFAVLPVRGVLYTLTSSVPLLVAIQVLDGVANSIFLVASAVFIANRTRGSGHFNLALGAFGAVTGTGAALSNGLAGFLALRAGFTASFLVLAAIAAAAFLCLLLFVPDRARYACATETEKMGGRYCASSCHVSPASRE